jgi:hypothetical protein
VPPRAKVTFEEDARGAVHVQVLTSERLGTLELAAFLRYEPEDYLQRAVSIECWRDAGTGILLPEIRAGYLVAKLADRYLDVSNGSEERRRLGLLVRQEDVRVVWPNEELEFPLSLEPARREYLAKAAAQDVDKATWRELVAEHKWQGTESWRPGLPRPKRRRPRTATPPAAHVPYFAPRSGTPPRTGAPRVGGIALPRGTRAPEPWGGFWCSEDPSEETFAFASHLARAFPETGLWPLLWDSQYESPADYWSGGGDVDPVDEVDAATVLAEGWHRYPPRPEWVEPIGVEFPGLAEPTLAPGGAFDPFSAIHRHRGAFPDAIAGTLEPRLLLVSCNRPADAIAAMGYVPNEIAVEQAAAVLRSWEERFGAVTTSFFGTVELAVAAPPRSFEHALRVAAEHYAFAPHETAGRPGALREFALWLTDEAASLRSWRSSATVSPNVWTLGWD